MTSQEQEINSLRQTVCGRVNRPGIRMKIALEDNIHDHRLSLLQRYAKRKTGDYRCRDRMDGL
jgi:hypothetical protein